MIRKIVIPLMLFGIVLSGCSQSAGTHNQKEVQADKKAEKPISTQTVEPAVIMETPTATPGPGDNPLSALKGKIVKDEQGYVILLGFTNDPNAHINYQFPESYHFPHDHIKDDFRILDGKGVALEYEEVDPGEMNLYVENPLGKGISDPRVFRIRQNEVQGPLTLDLENLIQTVNQMGQPALSFTIQFEAGFPIGKNKWDVDQPINLIPNHPFIFKYFDATSFNDYGKGKFGGPQNTFFYGSYYLEAAGFEGINFNQIVPPDRQAEWPEGGGGSEQACPEIYANCVMSDAGLLYTKENGYQLEITTYSLIVHGPWKVQSDLPR
jgi:hypothetical protein